MSDEITRHRRLQPQCDVGSQAQAFVTGTCSRCRSDRLGCCPSHLPGSNSPGAGTRGWSCPAVRSTSRPAAAATNTIRFMPTSLPVRPLRRLKNTGGNGRPRRFSPPPHRHPLLTPPPLPLRKWAEETPVAGCPGSVAAVAKSCIPTTGAGAGRLKPPSGWPVQAGRGRFGGRGGPAGLSNPSPGGCDHPTNRFLEIDHTVPVADRGRTEITNTWRI